MSYASRSRRASAMRRRAMLSAGPTGRDIFHQSLPEDLEEALVDALGFFHALLGAPALSSP